MLQNPSVGRLGKAEIGGEQEAYISCGIVSVQTSSVRWMHLSFVALFVVVLQSAVVWMLLPFSGCYF